MLRFTVWFALVFWASVERVSLAQEPVRQENQKGDTKNRYEFNPRHDPNGLGKFYLGREIAHVMTHEGAGWLDRTEREKEENPKRLLELLKIRPDQVVVDFCAGSGSGRFGRFDFAGGCLPRAFPAV